MDFNRATSISLALRKISFLLCYLMVNSNSQKLVYLFLVYTVQVLSSVNVWIDSSLFSPFSWPPIIPWMQTTNVFFFFLITLTGVEFWDAHIFVYKVSVNTVKHMKQFFFFFICLTTCSHRSLPQYPPRLRPLIVLLSLVNSLVKHWDFMCLGTVDSSPSSPPLHENLSYFRKIHLLLTWGWTP